MQNLQFPIAHESTVLVGLSGLLTSGKGAWDEVIPDENMQIKLR